MKKFYCLLDGKSVEAVVDESHVSFSTHGKFSAFNYHSADVKRAIEECNRTGDGLIISKSMDSGFLHDVDELFSRLYTESQNLEVNTFHMDNGKDLVFFFHKKSDGIITINKPFTSSDGSEEHETIIVADPSYVAWWLNNKALGDIIRGINNYIDFSPWNRDDAFLQILDKVRLSRKRKESLPL